MSVPFPVLSLSRYQESALLICMIFVEHKKRFLWFQWAKPLRKEKGDFDVKSEGDTLQVAGRVLIASGKQELPSDLLSQYQIARKNRSKQRRGKDSPHIRFANADTDEELIAFVRSFGPVVAKSVRMRGGRRIIALIAGQDLNELRKERLIYRAALGLVSRLENPIFDYAEARFFIREIAANINDWPRQWERECRERKGQPHWRLSDDSVKRIEYLSRGLPDALLPPIIDGRIVICELVNAFPSMVFPSPLEMNASIRYGIRPLLYAILRRELLNPHDTGICGNTQCRDFFEVERAGQQFCSPECSLHQRQRDYWKDRGKKLRAKRSKKRRKQARGT
jgi:hypothetical protein